MDQWGPRDTQRLHVLSVSSHSPKACQRVNCSCTSGELECKNTAQNVCGSGTELEASRSSQWALDSTASIERDPDPSLLQGAPHTDPANNRALAPEHHGPLSECNVSIVVITMLYIVMTSQTAGTPSSCCNRTRTSRKLPQTHKRFSGAEDPARNVFI